MFSSVRATATTKNGLARTMSAFVIAPRRHQAISSRTPGRMATEPLLSIARTNMTRLSQYQRLIPGLGGGGAARRVRDFWLESAAAGRAPSGSGSTRRYESIDSRKNTIDSVFL